MTEPLRVVVVEESSFLCRLMTSYLEAAPDLQVVGSACTGARAVELVRTLRPQVVALELRLPDMSGLEVLDQIMHECPTPVVLVSSTHEEAADLALRGLSMGAVDVVQKYTPGTDQDAAQFRQGLVLKLRQAARIHVIRSLHARRPVNGASLPRPQRGAAAPAALAEEPPSDALPPPLERVIVIGASTGGPSALRELLSGLPADFAAAVLVVQHMPETFTHVLAAQLDRAVPMQVREATHGDRLVHGTVFVAPGDHHLLVEADDKVVLTQDPEVGGHRPAVDVTMQSVAHHYGARSQGVVLTGMGADGALGVVAMHAKGGTIFAQDAASCVVDGMPQRAVDTGVVAYVGPPSQIAQRLLCEPPSETRS